LGGNNRRRDQSRHSESEIKIRDDRFYNLEFKARHWPCLIFFRFPQVVPLAGSHARVAFPNADQRLNPTPQLPNLFANRAPATMFYGSNSIMGDTHEIWLIKDGFLYEVMTYKQLDSWLAPIMQTWQFTP
jgi:hypothetical protein